MGGYLYASRVFTAYNWASIAFCKFIPGCWFRVFPWKKRSFLSKCLLSWAQVTEAHKQSLVSKLTDVWPNRGFVLHARELFFSFYIFSSGTTQLFKKNACPLDGRYKLKLSQGYIFHPRRSHCFFFILQKELHFYKHLD